MTIKWHTEQRKISDLLPADYNPRRLTEKQKKQLNKSLSKFGYVETIDINLDNTVIGGHQRLKVLADLGYKDNDLIDVRVPERLLTKDEEKELNLRLNKNLGEFIDNALFNNFTKEMLEDVGFENLELQNIFPTKKEIDIKSTYQIIVECLNELEQEKAYELLTKNNFNCKIVSI